MEIRNKTGKCTFDFCDEPVDDESEIFCPEHKQASEDAGALLLAAEREFYGEGWPPRQQPRYEASDS